MSTKTISSEQCYAAEHAVRSSSSLLLPPSQYAAGEMMLRRAEPPSVLPFVDLLLQYSAHNYHPLPMYVLCSLSARGSSRALGQCSLGATPRALGSPFASGLRCGDSSNSSPFSAFKESRRLTAIGLLCHDSCFDRAEGATSVVFASSGHSPGRQVS
jgi:hypothetical protein